MLIKYIIEITFNSNYRECAAEVVANPYMVGMDFVNRTCKNCKIRKTVMDFFVVRVILKAVL